MSAESVTHGPISIGPVSTVAPAKPHCEKGAWVFGPQRCYGIMTIWCVVNIGPFTLRVAEANPDPKSRHKNLSKQLSNSNAGIRGLGIPVLLESFRRCLASRLIEMWFGVFSPSITIRKAMLIALLG